MLISKYMKAWKLDSSSLSLTNSLGPMLSYLCHSEQPNIGQFSNGIVNGRKPIFHVPERYIYYAEVCEHCQSLQS